MTIPKRLSELLEEKTATTVAWPETMPKVPLGLPNLNKPAVMEPTTFNSGGNHPGINVNYTPKTQTENEPEEQESSSAAPSTQAEQDQESSSRGVPRSVGPGLNLSLEIPHPITNFPTPASPRSSSVNDEYRLINLINDLMPIKNTTSWE